jgi:CrcB protein
MSSYFLVFLGAGIGGALRHGVNLAALRLLGPGFPHGTLAVNVIGSFALGLLTGWFALRFDPGQSWRLFLTTGMLGGFTTFSAFSLDAALLWERGDFGVGALYVLASVVLAVLGLWAGLLIMRHLA